MVVVVLQLMHVLLLQLHQQWPSVVAAALVVPLMVLLRRKAVVRRGTLFIRSPVALARTVALAKAAAIAATRWVPSSGHRASHRSFGGA